MRRCPDLRPSRVFFHAVWLVVLATVANAYDVQEQRTQYFKEKEALAQRVLKENGVTFDAQGRPVKDANFAKATDAFKAQDAALRTQYDANGARDTALDHLLEKAGVDRKSVIEASGSKPGSEDYRGFLGDRDITIKDPAQVEAILKAAGDKAVIHRERNRITIEGLDCNIYLNDGVSGVANVKAGIRDPEVVIAPTPAQQVKKVAGHFDGDIPDGTAEQMKLLQEVSKGAYKADKSLRQAGGEPVLSESEANRFSQRKAGQDAETELELLGMPPEERKKFLEQTRDESAGKIREAVDRYEKVRDQQIDKLQQAQDWAKSQARQAADAGDHAQAEQFLKQAADAKAQQKALIKERQCDHLTTDVVAKTTPEAIKKLSPNDDPDGRKPIADDDPDARKKPTDDEGNARKKPTGDEPDAHKTPAGDEPNVRKTQTGADEDPMQLKLFGHVDGDAPDIHPTTTNKTPAAPDTPHTTKPVGPTPGQARVQKGLSWIGNIMAVYDAYQTEAEDAKKTGREFSWMRVSGHAVLNVTGIAGAWSAGQSMRHETTKGTQDYIERQLKEFKDAGYDVSSFNVRAWIAAKAIARGTALGSYEGAKGVPMIGDVIGAPENAIRLAEATWGLIQDTRRSNATVAGNEQARADQITEALRFGKEQLGFLPNLHGMIIKQDQELARMLEQAKKANEQLPKVHAQIVDDQALLTAFARDADVLKGNLADLRARIQAMVTELNSVRTTADAIAGPVADAIPRLLAKQMSPEAGRGLLTSSVKRYEALQTACTELERRAEALMKLAQPTQAAAAIAGARTRTATILADLKKASDGFAGMEELAKVQVKAVEEYRSRRESLINGITAFHEKAPAGSTEKNELKRVLVAAQALPVLNSPADEALRVAQEMKQAVNVLSRMAQKMPFPPEQAQQNLTSAEQVVKEFEVLKAPAEKADAAMTNLRNQLVKLERAIGSAGLSNGSPGPIPPPKVPITPGTKEEPKPEPPAKTPAEPNYAAMGGQLTAIYAAAMQRRFATYKDGATYKVEFRKPWAWNAAKRTFECDIAIWQTSPRTNQDPKTFKPYITSELIGSMNAAQAQGNIATGKWFGE